MKFIALCTNRFENINKGYGWTLGFVSSIEDAKQKYLTFVPSGTLTLEIYTDTASNFVYVIDTSRPKNASNILYLVPVKETDK